MHLQLTSTGHTWDEAGRVLLVFDGLIDGLTPVTATVHAIAPEDPSQGRAVAEAIRAAFRLGPEYAIITVEPQAAAEAEARPEMTSGFARAIAEHADLDDVDGLRRLTRAVTGLPRPDPHVHDLVAYRRMLLAIVRWSLGNDRALLSAVGNALTDERAN